MPNKCAFGCKSNVAVSMHRFPNPLKFSDRFKTWVELVGGVLETDADFEYFKNKRVCDIHFTTADRNRNSRLNALAVPSLHLPHQFKSQQLQPSTSSSTINDITDQKILAAPSANMHSLDKDEHDNSLWKQVVLEHNYSAVSKARRPFKFGKEKLRPLSGKVKQLRKEIVRLQRKSKSYISRLKFAESLSTMDMFRQVTKNLSEPAQLFLNMQIQNSKKKKGRRFTTKEKVLALSMYKKSPKCYALLYKLFTLPAAKAMKRLLSNIKLEPGINPIIFKRIKKTVLDLEQSDRLCSLIFDKMSLTPQIFYSTQKDCFEGFATNKENQFADHVLVFMIKGIKKNIKQPIAYYFTNCLNKWDLKTMIKCVIMQAQDSGLIIVNTVCDQSTVNVGAITELINESKANYLRLGKQWQRDAIWVQGQSIIPIFDAPHLIKGIRNNLLTKDMVYTTNNEDKIVKWEYYQKVYAADKSYGELRLLHKLTEEHINTEKIKKMRVKLATQVFFSHSVAVATEHLTARGNLPNECRQLIDITLLLDDLFDSLNVNTLHIPNGKKFKGPIKRHSPHHDLWTRAKLILKTLKFRKINKVSNELRFVDISVPSVSNLIKSIEGMESMWKMLSQKYGFDALLTRNLNQDPIENFFGNIRSYGARNVAPNTISFEGAFKALLLNNYNSPHSAKANCEEDINQCLQKLEFFLTDKSHASIPPYEDTNDQMIQMNEEIHFKHDLLENGIKETDAGQGNYVCGWILTKCLKNVCKSCKSCKQNLVDRDNNNNKNAFIKAKEYCDKKWLCYPSEELSDCFRDLQNIITGLLVENGPKKEIKKNIILVADMLLEYPFRCTLHKEKLKSFFLNTTINLILCSWCRSVNRTLSGKLFYLGNDKIKSAAQLYYNKHKHNKNKK